MPYIIILNLVGQLNFLKKYQFQLFFQIYEGSSVYASAIANKLIDVVDREYAASQPTSSY